MSKTKTKAGHGGARKGGGRKKTLDDQITQSIVFDKPSRAVVKRYQVAHSCGRSEAVRALIMKSKATMIGGIDD